MDAVVVMAAYFLPAHEPVRVHEGEAFQQRLHVHQGKPSHHAGSLNRTEPVLRIWIGSGFNWVSKSGFPIRIRNQIQAGQNWLPKREKLRNFMFEES
jgi:hypothetical protein